MHLKSYTLRFLLGGCTNRPFYHIVMAKHYALTNDKGVDHLGTYDPMPNKHNQKVVSIDIAKLKYCLGNGCNMSRPVAKLLGLSGLVPLHPSTLMDAEKNRDKLAKQAQEEANPTESGF